jgi:farnesyl diphosphate synthase
MPTTLMEFETVFPTLVKDMKEHCQSYKLPEQALTWFEQVGQHRLISNRPFLPALPSLT